MLAAERRHIIMTTLEQQGSVSVADLVAQFGVSEVTIRKDLELLAQSGSINRVHGGAMLRRDRPFTLSYDFRGPELLGEKQSIGRAAADLVGDNETIVMDCGTTTIHLAKNLGSGRALRCLTNDIQIALTLAVWPHIKATLTAGIVRGLTMPLWGPECERSILAQRQAHKTFLSISGIDVTGGLTNTYAVEVRVKQAMIEIGQEVILLVDSSKFGKVAQAYVAELTAVHKIITGRNAPQDMIGALRQQGIEVVLV